MATPRAPSACVPGSGHNSYPFCNSTLPLDARVRDLVRRIKDEDKPKLLTARAEHGLPYLGVPGFYWGTNCVNKGPGYGCVGKRCPTSFPSGPSLSATFNREIQRRVGAAIARETRAMWNVHGGMRGISCWGPVLELTRDPRWGRIAESGSEDPYLLGELGAAITRGMQQGDAGDKGVDPRYLLVAATVKHMAVNSLEGEWGGDPPFEPGGRRGGPVSRHNLDAEVSRHDLVDSYWPAFRASIRAGARGVMCAYNGINGVPACLDPLQRAARASWGFSGYVVSDTDSVADAFQEHQYAPDGSEAAALAIRDGGCDLNSGPSSLATARRAWRWR